MTDAEQQIRTTNTGSLPRSLAVTGALARRAAGEPGGTDEVITAAVGDMVQMQVGAGIGLVGNGEASRESYITYVRDRLTGLDGTGHIDLPCTDVEQFPAHMARVMGQLPPLPACTGPVAYQGIAVNSEIEDLLLALHDAGRGARDGFLSAVTPGTIAMFVPNRFYPTEEAWVYALAAAMRTEYTRIAAAGLTLRLDAPDLACLRDRAAGPAGEARADLHLHALNYATEDIDPARMELHVCHGSYNGPHAGDAPLADLLPQLLRARPAGLCIEMANPRHEHEWTVFQTAGLPEGKYLVAGVIDPTTCWVEHPRLVAQRLERLGRLLRPGQLAAGTDCGFAPFAAMAPVPADIAAAKLAALADGASLASQTLAGRRPLAAR